ncbi:hypothetical protein DL95DRAFT_441292 [Leptodontidium sp. 2 PMI_412]|nr:hypothetical protein DL95DRAFT_441292 [Leptodontidium sp. 2 PMI_412]
MEMDLQPQSDFSESCPPTPTATTFSQSRIDREITVADPKTPAGQIPGAVLLVKSTPVHGNTLASKRKLEVGELVKVVKHMGAYCRVRPLRTGDDEWTVHWSVFFPLGIKTRCSCEEGTCRCEVEWAGRCVPENVPACVQPSSENIKPASEGQEQTKPPVLAADPHTLEGQTTGAILVIRHKASIPKKYQNCPVEVGDYIQLLEGPSKDAGKVVPAKNLRTGVVGHVTWGAVFPLEEREMCHCFRTTGFSKCRCVYIDFEASLHFEKNTT